MKYKNISKDLVARLYKKHSLSKEKSIPDYYINTLYNSLLNEQYRMQYVLAFIDPFIKDLDLHIKIKSFLDHNI